MKKDNKKKQEEAKFELVLSDGRSRKFDSGRELYDWARTCRKNWRYEDKETEQANREE